MGKISLGLFLDNLCILTLFELKPKRGISNCYMKAMKTCRYRKCRSTNRVCNCKWCF